MNFGQMRALVRETARDASGSLLKDWELDTWLNQGYADLAARLRSYQKEVRQSDGGAAQITSGALVMPADLIEITSLRLGTNDVEFTSDDIFNSYADANDDGLDHTLARVWNNNSIEFWPAPANSAAYHMRYAAYPEDLDQADDIPVFPPDMHERIVNYARAMALFKDQNDYGNVYMGLFERDLPMPNRGKAKLRPGPLTVGFEPGPFDTSDARHW